MSIPLPVNSYDKGCTRGVEIPKKLYDTPADQLDPLTIDPISAHGNRFESFERAQLIARFWITDIHDLIKRDD